MASRLFQITSSLTIFSIGVVLICSYSKIYDLISKITLLYSSLKEIERKTEIIENYFNEKINEVMNEINEKKKINYIDSILHELCGDTPEETINIIISVFCCCLVEALAYKINVDELNDEDSKDMIRSTFGASIRSHQLAQEEMLEMCI